MTYRSTPELLVLHGARVLGGPSAAAIATRFGLAEADVREHLLDAQAYGWVSRYDYFGETWSLTERGREVGERLLAEELAATGTLELVSQVHRDFLPLNVRHGIASTRWQLKPTRWDPRAFNDHSDPVWDHEVLSEFEAIDAEFAVLADELAAALQRFYGYAQRHSAAVARARAGQLAWLDAPDRASCQLVWIQFHEDLLASLGIPRGSDG
ncbi:MAG: transcriptional regulator [Propionicimonas sp.]